MDVFWIELVRVITWFKVEAHVFASVYLSILVVDFWMWVLFKLLFYVVSVVFHIGSQPFPI